MHTSFIFLLNRLVLSFNYSKCQRCIKHLLYYQKSHLHCSWCFSVNIQHIALLKTDIVQMDLCSGPVFNWKQGVLQGHCTVLQGSYLFHTDITD